jgi:hypothetical protein
MTDLKRGSETYRQQLIAGRLATADELAPYWPGGEENEIAAGKRATVRHWLRCYTVYGGFARRVEWREAKRDGSAEGQRRVLLDAIGEVPEVVELMGIDPATNRRRTLTVYQKSDVALKEVHKANMDLAICVEQYEAWTQRDTVAAVEAAGRWLDEMTYLQRLIIWIVTTGGPRLPYPEGERCPDLPPEYADLSPVDFYGVAQAYQRVNVLPLTVLEQSLTPKGRADWATFWAGAEAETGVAAPMLRRDRGLAGLVCTVTERARAQDEARAEAKARAEAESHSRRGMMAGRA